MIEGVLTTVAATCDNKGITILPTWYKYIDGTQQPGGGCELNFMFPEHIPAIALAIVEILLRVGALAAVAFVIYGGFLYVTSQGEPDQAAAARKTIINAVVGLAIALLATVVVSFIGGSLL